MGWPHRPAQRPARGTGIYSATIAALLDAVCEGKILLLELEDTGDELQGELIRIEVNVLIACRAATSPVGFI